MGISSLRPLSSEHLPGNNRVVKKLYYENSGGGGHKEAVKFRVAEDLAIAKREGYTLVPIVLDALNSCGRCFGRMNAKGWNQAKKAGDIRKQTRLVRMQWIADIIYFLPILIRTLYNILKHDIHEIYDAQILGTKAMLLAARIANRFFRRFRKNPVLITKQMTDLAHRDSQHFFRSLRKLSRRDKKIFKLVVPHFPPLIEEKNKAGQLLTEEEFWKKHTHLSMTHIEKAAPPVRKAFKEWRHKHPIHDRPNEGFSVKVNSDKEIKLLQELLGNPNLHITTPSAGKRCLSVPLTHKENDVIIAESVGSQVPEKAILDDVKVAMETPLNPQKQYKMFVACGRDEPKGLYGKVVDLIKQKKATNQFPPNLQIIPMTYQDDTELAPLLCCSNNFDQGAGGLTSFEALEVLYDNPLQEDLLQKGKVLVRSIAEKPKNSAAPLNQEELLKKGFSVWESGNARTLKVFLKGTYSDVDVLRKQVFEG